MEYKILSLQIHQGTYVRPGKLVQDSNWYRRQMIRMLIEKIGGLAKSAIYINPIRIETREEQ